MKIALDYDNTYSVDPIMWKAFIQIAQAAGHEVRIVTARDDRYDRTPEIVATEQILPVVYCRGVAKRWFMLHNGGGFAPDIWIDDKPESILVNSDMLPHELSDWRSGRNEGDCQ